MNWNNLLGLPKAMKETDPQRAVREIVAHEVADPIGLMKAIGEPERAGVNTPYRSDDLTVLNLIWGPEIPNAPRP